MALTVAAVLVTNDLAVGVAVGVLATVLFARRVAHVTRVDRSLVDGVDRFAYADDPAEAVVDLTHAQVGDASTVAVLDAIGQRYADHGRSVRFEGLDDRSAAFHARLTGRLGE